MELKQKNAYELARLLFSIHTHGEICEPDEIVYRENDVIRLLAFLGYPKPDFDQIGKVHQFWNGNPPAFDDWPNT
jgi:hypothetical protein